MVTLAKTRKSPVDEDIDRINETLFRNYGGGIKDEESYQLAYDDYFGASMNEGIKALQGDAFNEYRDRHPQVMKGSIFKKARGKNLKRDRETTSKTVVQDPKEYIKSGASRVDLQGYDTKGALRSKPQKRELNQLGKVKGVTVYAYESTIRKGTTKERVILRDRRGRFVKRL